MFLPMLITVPCLFVSTRPRAMLSDFGTSQDMLGSRTRSGNTGTYVVPEAILHQVKSVLGHDFGKDAPPFFRRSHLYLLLHEARTMLIRTEFGNVAKQILNGIVRCVIKWASVFQHLQFPAATFVVSKLIQKGTSKTACKV